jgi:hypothetical protein
MQHALNAVQNIYLSETSILMPELKTRVDSIEISQNNLCGKPVKINFCAFLLKTDRN